jgi:NAD(P)H-hydrate epimerase
VDRPARVNAVFPFREKLPGLTTEQMIEVDRAMIDDYGITLAQMMETAGRNLAHLSRVRFLDGSSLGARVVVLAGTGGNGGGAMVCARRLANWGADVRVVVTAPDDSFAGVPGHQLRILHRMGISVSRAEGVSEILADGPVDLVIDGIIGYSLRGEPRGDAKKLIDWANGQRAPILALDVPSGIDATSGRVCQVAVRASATLTLALPKTGLSDGRAQEYVGELYLADIGVPPELYASASIGLNVASPFAESDIVRIQ